MDPAGHWHLWKEADVAEEVEEVENHGFMLVSLELFSGVSIFHFNFMLAMSLSMAVSRSKPSVLGMVANDLEVADWEWDKARESAKG